MQPNPLMPLRMTVGSLAMGCVVIAAVVLIVLPPNDQATLVQQVLPILLPLVTAALARAYLGVAPKPVGTGDPEQQAMGVLRQRTFVAAALTEAGGLLAFALGFVMQLPPVAVAIALVLTGALVLAVAWPRQTRLDEWTRELKRLPRH